MKISYEKVGNNVKFCYFKFVLNKKFEVDLCILNGVVKVGVVGDLFVLFVDDIGNDFVKNWVLGVDDCFFEFS